MGSAKLASASGGCDSGCLGGTIGGVVGGTLCAVGVFVGLYYLHKKKKKAKAGAGGGVIMTNIATASCATTEPTLSTVMGEVVKTDAV